MNPTNNSPRLSGTPTPPTRSQSFRPPSRQSQSAQQNAAANVVRGQINSIYDGNSGENTPHTTPTPVQNKQPEIQQTQAQPQPKAQPQQQNTSHNFRTSPQREPSANQQVPDSLKKQDNYQPQVTAEQWSQYHSAWQKYYQTYYERYYVNHLSNKQREMRSYIESNIANSHQDNTPAADNPEPDETVSQSDAVKQLRSEIRQKVRDNAKKVKKSRHFVPAIAGVVVVLVFVFLQYNRVIFGAVAAYTTPGNIEPQNIIVDPTVNVEVGPEPRMVIPKINIDAPVVYGIGADHDSQMKAMESGIAHFSIPGANAVPGQVGNAVFAAHSSNDAFARGDYKFVFAQNEKLAKDDIIYMNYNSKRYTYKVTSMEVVLPSEVNKIQIQTDKPMLTLISCVPLGTAEKRLLVFAEQISPDPSGAAESSQQNSDESSGQETDKIPGQPSPTIFERMFGG